MVKKAKEETLDLFYLDNSTESKKTTKKKKEKNHTNNTKKNTKKQTKKDVNKNTKEEKFDFNDEIVIGLTKIDDPVEKKKKVNSKKNNSKKEKQLNNQKKTKQQNKKSKNKENHFEDDMMISDIYSKQNVIQENKTNGKNKKVSNQPSKKNKPIKKLTKQQEIARKKRKAVFKLIKWTSLVVIIIAGIIYTLLSPIFNVKKIEVGGNSKISSDEIISLSNIETEQNMFQYQSKEIIENVRQNAYIDKVIINRKLPDTIELIVSERKATYMIQVANAYAYIDNQGYILEISDQEKELPTLIGLSTKQEEIHEGKRLCTEDLEKLNDILKIMESANSNGILDLITKINIKDSTNYILTLSSKKKTVYFGDVSNLSTKMLWIIKFNEEEKNTKGIIFLNMNLNNENSKPYFRKDV